MTPFVYEAEVCRVIDGDSVVCNISCGFDIYLNKQNIRLYKIDTPETRGGTAELKALGYAAKNYVKEELPPGSKVLVRTYIDGRGKFGRLLASIYKSEGDGFATKSINSRLLEMRLAVEYMGQSKADIMIAHHANVRYHQESGLLR